MEVRAGGGLRHGGPCGEGLHVIKLDSPLMKNDELRLDPFSRRKLMHTLIQSSGSSRSLNSRIGMKF